MRPTDVLRAEHEKILRACHTLEEMAQRISDVPVGHATYLVDFIQQFADGVHHAKEEQVLFPALEEEGMPRNGGPIGVMLLEHERGREHVAGMRSALSAFDAPSGRALFAKHAQGFAALLEQHIQKENMVLFTMADRMIPTSRDGELLNAFAEIDNRHDAGRRRALEFDAWSSNASR